MISSLINAKEKKKLKTQALLRKMHTQFPPDLPKDSIPEQTQPPFSLSMKVQNIPPPKPNDPSPFTKQSINSLTTKNTLFTTLSDENLPDPQISSSIKSPSKHRTMNTNKTCSTHYNTTLSNLNDLSNTIDTCTNRQEIFQTINTKVFQPIQQEYKTRSISNNEIQTNVNKLNNNISSLQEQIKQSEHASKLYTRRSKVMTIDLEKTAYENKYIETETQKTQQQICALRDMINKIQKEKIVNENDYENEVNDLDELKSSVKKIKVSIDEINADIKNMKSAKFLINKKIDEVKMKMKQKGKNNQFGKQLSGILKTVLTNK